MDREPPPPAPRAVLTPSHVIALGVAAVVISAVAVVAVVLTRAGQPGPPDGTYRLIARDSARCLAVAPAAAVDAPDVSTAASAPLVRLTTCPDTSGRWDVPAPAEGLGTGLGGAAVLDAGGRQTATDPAGGHWTVQAAEGSSRLTLRAADDPGRCLTATTRASVSPVTVVPCEASAAQTWTLRQVGRSDYFQVVADQGRRCLDTLTIDGAVTAVQKMCSSQPSQQWRFDPAD